jgi:hypothetical protein
MVCPTPQGEATVVVTGEALGPNDIDYINLGSVFDRDRPLNTANPEAGRDQRLLERLGMTVEPARAGF